MTQINLHNNEDHEIKQLSKNEETFYDNYYNFIKDLSESNKFIFVNNCNLRTMEYLYKLGYNNRKFYKDHVFENNVLNERRKNSNESIGDFTQYLTKKYTLLKQMGFNINTSRIYRIVGFNKKMGKYSPLSIALCNKHSLLASILIDLGAKYTFGQLKVPIYKIIDICDNDDDQIMNTILINKLINNSTNINDKFFDKLLIYAIITQYNVIIDTLLNRGIMINHKNKHKSTIKYVIDKENISVLEILLKYLKTNYVKFNKKILDDEISFTQKEYMKTIYQSRKISMVNIYNLLKKCQIEYYSKN